ncbi:hypothetical protein L6452_18055 [Arctium lappa]|uniref:Uncharacterized protein n=1 Tax=Arctium lappa TaxID=4217 RepID=A0ACB9C553_ARCLA|nr:hypothetical protein L6452_18055 [Arctium lappa]
MGFDGDRFQEDVVSTKMAFMKMGFDGDWFRRKWVSTEFGFDENGFHEDLSRCVHVSGFDLHDSWFPAMAPFMR